MCHFKYNNWSYQENAVDLTILITPFIGFPIFYIKYLARHNVQMQADALGKLFYGLRVFMGDNPRARWFVRLSWGQYRSPRARVLSP